MSRASGTIGSGFFILACITGLLRTDPREPLQLRAFEFRCQVVNGAPWPTLATFANRPVIARACNH